MLMPLQKPLLAAVLALCAGAAMATTPVPGSSNPKLAGMPDGTPASSGDVAPAQSPVLFTEFNISPGQWLRFAATGVVDHCGGGCPGQTPDGAGTFSNGAENGISGINAPVDSLLGVFLGADAPNLGAAPAALNFALIGRDFATLQPLLKQVFFIGDGSTSGELVQQFQVPTGATRLYLATHDGFGWYNNSGMFSVSVSAVPEPASAALTLIGGLALGALVRQRRRRA